RGQRDHHAGDHGSHDETGKTKRKTAGEIACKDEGREGDAVGDLDDARDRACYHVTPERCRIQGAGTLERQVFERQQGRYAAESGGLTVAIMTSTSGNSKAEAATLAQARLSGSCAAQPIGESTHHRNGEERRLMHKKKESLLGNRGNFASRLGLRGGRGRRAAH